MAIKSNRKPIKIALIDGICSGSSGLGLAVHSPLRVVTEKSSISLNNSKLGINLDSGISKFCQMKLNNTIAGSNFSSSFSGVSAYSSSGLSGMKMGKFHLGNYLALTGATISGVDAFKFGIGTHFCPSSLLAGELYFFILLSK